MSFRPDRFHSITPYLMVHQADKLMEFLKEAFDAEIISTTRVEGLVRNAEILIGNSVIEIGERPTSDPVHPIHLHLYVEDAEKVHAQALKAGGEELYPPSMQNYGDMEGGIKDPTGNSWYIATHVDPEKRK